MINHIALQPTLIALQQAISSGALSLNQVDASVAQILVSKGRAVCKRPHQGAIIYSPPARAVSEDCAHVCGDGAGTWTASIVHP